MSRIDSLTPFPILLDETAQAWTWPAPPYVWHHEPPPDNEVAQPCCIETSSGTIVEGFMLGIDPRIGKLSFRTDAEGAALALPFSRFRRLTLTTPLKSIVQRAGEVAQRVPAATQERPYRLITEGDGNALSGRTLGHVDTAEGLFLFPPGDDEWSLLRVFVPRWACGRSEFGPTAQDVAAERWIATPRALLAALEQQRLAPVLPIGQALLDLGLVTPEQLDRALAQQQGDVPLGERLVESHVISHADLQTAIAHKMGYPLVDLSRFPIDLSAAYRLPLRTAVKHRALPIMIERERLIVAVDRPSRAAHLQSLYALAGFTVVPVLASKSQILLALSGLPHHDGWSENVSIRAEFFSTTR